MAPRDAGEATWASEMGRRSRHFEPDQTTVVITKKKRETTAHEPSHILLFYYTGPSPMVGPTSPQVRGAGSTSIRPLCCASGQAVRRSGDTSPRRLAAASARRQRKPHRRKATRHRFRRPGFLHADCLSAAPLGDHTAAAFSADRALLGGGCGGPPQPGSSARCWSPREVWLPALSSPRFIALLVSSSEIPSLPASQANSSSILLLNKSMPFG